MSVTDQEQAERFASAWADKIAALERLHFFDSDEADDAINDLVFASPSAAHTFRRLFNSMTNPDWVGSELLLVDGAQRATLSWDGRDSYVVLSVTFNSGWTSRRILAPALAAVIGNLD